MRDLPSLPFESVLRWLLAGRYRSFFLWSAIEWLVVVLLLSTFEPMTFESVVATYGAITTLAILAMNLDFYFALSMWDRVRAAVPRIQELIEPGQHSEFVDIVADLFEWRRFAVVVGGVTVMGEATFALSGLNFQSEVTTTLAYVALVFIMSSLGFVLFTAIVVWLAVARVSRLRLLITPFHPDRVGGTHVLGELAFRVFEFGAAAAVIWSLAAYSAPYAIPEGRYLGFVWIVFATVMLIYAVIAPLLRLHESLKAAKDDLGRELAELYHLVYDRWRHRIVAGQSETPLQVPPPTLEAIRTFEDKLATMQVWPYLDFVRHLSLVSLAQPAAFLLGVVLQERGGAREIVLRILSGSGT